MGPAGELAAVSKLIVGPGRKDVVSDLSPLPEDRTSGLSKWDANDYDDLFRSPAQRPYQFFLCPSVGQINIETYRNEKELGDRLVAQTEKALSKFRGTQPENS